MSDKPLASKKIIMVIAQKDFRDEELLAPKELFLKEGAKIIIASTKLGIAEGMLGAKVEVDTTIANSDISACDALIIVGGAGSPKYLWDNAELQEKVKKAHSSGKLIGAICLAPVVLAKAGLLTGIKATVWNDQTAIEEFKKGNALYTNEKVIVSGKIITANGPIAAKEFGAAVVTALSQKP